MGLDVGRPACRGLGFTRLGALLDLICQLKAAGAKPRQIAPQRTVVANMSYALRGDFYQRQELIHEEVCIVNRQFQSHYQYLIGFGDLCHNIYATQVGDPLFFGFWKIQMVIEGVTWTAHGDSYQTGLFNLLLRYVLFKYPQRLDLRSRLAGSIVQVVDIMADTRPAYSVKTKDGRQHYIVSWKRVGWPGSRDHHYYEASLEQLYL